MEIKIEKLSADEIHKMGIKDWPIWEKEVSRFEWSYSRQEECLFLEGEVKVRTSAGQEVKIQKGDFVTFPQGLQCTWEVLRKVKKHYRCLI